VGIKLEINIYELTVKMSLLEFIVAGLWLANNPDDVNSRLMFWGI